MQENPPVRTVKNPADLLDRPLEVVDMRLPDRLVLRPYPEKPADAKSGHTAPTTPRKT